MVLIFSVGLMFGFGIDLNVVGLRGLDSGLGCCLLDLLAVLVLVVTMFIVS